VWLPIIPFAVDVPMPKVPGSGPCEEQRSFTTINLLMGVTVTTVGQEPRSSADENYKLERAYMAIWNCRTLPTEELSAGESTCY
jgi:hypothetical protein